jgi:DegV family protein with EDD domain
MKKIALVTDSTADLMEETQKEFDIHVIQLKVKFKKQEFLANEITSKDFYRRLAEEDELPKTSQPSPEDFTILYRKLLQDNDEVISIHIASKLSGTLNSANVAKEGLKGRIHVIDSKNISLGMGLLVIEAAKNIREGLNSTQIVDRIARVRQNIETLFTINTLEYLQKGGRIGKVQGIVGNLLKIRPVVRVGDDGVYQTYRKVRNQKQALDSIVQAFRDLGKGRKQVSLAVAHGAARQAGLYLKEALEDTFQLKINIFTQVGPVIGVHTGPGTVGAAVQFE